MKDNKTNSHNFYFYIINVYAVNLINKKNVMVLFFNGKHKTLCDNWYLCLPSFFFDTETCDVFMREVFLENQFGCIQCVHIFLVACFICENDFMSFDWTRKWFNSSLKHSFTGK